MQMGFGLSEVLRLLSQSLLFYPLIRSVITAASKAEDDPRGAFKTILTGALTNVIFIIGVVVVVVLLRLL